RAPALKAERRYEFARLSALHAMISEDSKSVEDGAREIARLTAALQLPSQVREEARRLFMIAHKAGLLKSSTVAAMSAACVILACKELGLPSPQQKLLQLVPSDPRRVRRSYLALLEHVSRKVALKPVSPLKYVPMIASKLGLSTNTQRIAPEVIRAAEEAKLLLGKPPRSVAAAALYVAALVCGERARRQELAEAPGITETTLRKRARELLRKLDITVQV
ncbi:MAG: hypothetical protein ABWK01_10020, partial [Infirmifilum sp.]